MHAYINTVYLRLTIGYRQVVKYMCGFTPLWTLVCPSASGSVVKVRRGERKEHLLGTCSIPDALQCLSLILTTL